MRVRNGRKEAKSFWMKPAVIRFLVDSLLSVQSPAAADGSYN